MKTIYYDCETTGTNVEDDRIIELAAYCPEDDQSFSSFVSIDFTIPKEATQIHGITNSMIENAPTFSEVFKLFKEFCSEDSLLIAHNNDSFDAPLLKNECKRFDLELPKWQYLDSLKWARKYRPDLPKHSLQYLREAYQIEKNNAHRALEDVKTLYKVFSFMIDDLSPKTLLSLMTQPNQLLKIMPFGKHQGTPIKKVPVSYLKWLKEQGALDKPGNENLKEACEAVLNEIHV